MDEFLYSLQVGWEIPPGFPRDRFVPTGYGKSDLVAPIVQYLDDFGFTGDARRLHEAAKRFYAHQDWQRRQMRPRPSDDKGWQEFQERCVNPLGYLSVCLQGSIRDVRQLIIDAAGREAATQTRGKGGRKKVVESAKDSEESSNAIEVTQGPSLRDILTDGLSVSEMNMLAKLIELERQYGEQPNSKSNPLWRKRYDANEYQKERELKGK
jgi:hypothetical protein